MLHGLVSHAKVNGRRGQVVAWLQELGKYQVKLDDGRVVYLMPGDVWAPERMPMEDGAAEADVY